MAYLLLVSFAISVVRLSDRAFLAEPPDFRSVASDEWDEEARRRVLFSAVLGTDAECRDHWSSPAEELSLPLLASLYTRGLEVDGPRLDALDKELDTLIDHWSRAIDENDKTLTDVGGRMVTVPVVAQVAWRAEGLRNAIRLAQRIDGFVSVF